MAITETGRAAAALAAEFEGQLIRPDDEGYEQARRVWNGDVDRRPALVARCRTTSDVQRVVAVAAAEELPLSVRGGGHSAPGYGTNDGGLVLDLSLFKEVAVDPAAGTARGGGGVLWRACGGGT